MLLTACGSRQNETLLSPNIENNPQQSNDAPVEPPIEQNTPAQKVIALYRGSAELLSEEEAALYDSTVKVLLTQELWTSRDAYDACHYLMVPMYYAFRSGDTNTIWLFSSFFQRFAEDLDADPSAFEEISFLDQLHFLYFCTQYMNLCVANGYEEAIPQSLPLYAQETAEEYLLRHVANWKTEPTVIEHMRQVIAGKEYKRSYYSSIEDFDKFTLAILCDLKCYYTMREESYDDVLDTASDLVYQLYSLPHLNQETDGGGWLFQVGVGYDHPDKAYVGHETITEGMEPKPREDVPQDSNHAHRLPLHLRSYQSAQTEVERWNLFVLRRKQLANQMVNYVLKNVDGHWLTTTFMDGTNGVYRYSYNTEGVGYDLSGTFLLGWWSLLEDERIQSCYHDILERFPMVGNETNPYFDHATTRNQNPLFDMDTAFDLGMFECMVLCAGKMKG